VKGKSTKKFYTGLHQEEEAKEEDQDRTAVPSWSCSKAVYKTRTNTIGECTVNKLLMMDRGTVRNM
jgi:hypothetical protein